MEELFAPILDDDEVIESIYKPQKLKTFFSAILALGLPLLFFCGGLALALFVPEEGYKSAEPIACLIPIGIFIVCILVGCFFVNLKYKKTVYAVTNKRIIIRTGVIGVDFKSLDLSNIGAIDVYVGLLDKLLGGKTGTIRFGSASSPINGQNANNYTFKHVNNPYKTYKEIKPKIDAYKSKKSQETLR